MATLRIAYDMAPGATFIIRDPDQWRLDYKHQVWRTLPVRNVSSASLSMPLDGIGDGTAHPDRLQEAAGNARTGGVLPINSAGNYRRQHWGGFTA